MAPRSSDPHIPSASIQDDSARQDNKPRDTPDRVPRPSNIPRFPKRHASIDSPREIPLPSPALRQQETVSPFAVAFDAMDATSPFFSSRLHETVSDAAQGLISRPSSPSSLPQVSQSPYHMLPRTITNGPNGQGLSMPEGEQEGSGSPSSLGSNLTEFSSSSSSSSSSGSSSSDLGPPPLVASSSSGSSASLDSISSLSSGSSSYNPNAKGFSELSAFQNSRLSPSTFSSYSSNGLGSAYARPIRPASPPPYLARNSSVSSRLGGPRSSSVSTSSSYYLQPPEPPVVLPPEPYLSEIDDQSTSEFSSQMGASGSNRQAPHVPFLSHGPAPTESYIEVETTQREYRLHVKLPGFGRDAITLASKKRRILHIVADRWDGVGGHFERRISFGYDADLVQVRAEFDGEMLRIVVPRRLPPFGYWYS
ncbi:hypothetical protein AX14_004705 [Amanita brunnescens Koide BX004]|nr:hypothetical protein AX14_004705 [Amanita brunnescens Koide BX004]